MSEEPPLVTVLVPARDEEGDIEACLDAVLAQDHPHHRLEIVVVDGGSTDGTKRVATRRLTDGDVSWRILDNPTGTTPSNLNRGLEEARGTIVCRVDARSIVPSTYVSRCVEILVGRPEVVVVGGRQAAVAAGGTDEAHGIARALNNTYVMGGARYRSGSRSGPSDTVYLGSFRAQDLRAAGGWDPAMHSNQDYELNRRLARRGVVWFEAGLAVAYVPRARHRDLLRQYHRFGRWKVRYWRHTSDRPLGRQWRVLILPPGAVAGACTWAALGPRRRWAALAAAGLAGLAGIEALGAEGPATGPRGHAHGIVAIVVVGGGWLSGVLRELLVEPTLAGRPTVASDRR